MAGQVFEIGFAVCAAIASLIAVAVLALIFSAIIRVGIQLLQGKFDRKPGQNIINSKGDKK